MRMLEGPNPYQAPRVSSQPELAATAALPGFTDQARLVLILTALLGVQIALGATNALACILLNFGPFDEELETRLVQATDLVAKADFWLYLVTLIPFGSFLFRANKNARALSGGPREFSPASMVWWFAVPFLNLVRPFQAVRAVWDASTPTREPAGRSILPLWWALWLVTSLASRVSDRLTVGAEPDVHNYINAVINCLAATLAGVALLMVRALRDRQLECASEQCFTETDRNLRAACNAVAP